MHNTGHSQTMNRVVETKPERPPMVRALLNDQLKVIQSLDGLLEILEDRVRCVSRTEPKPPENSKCVEVPNSIMDTIAEHNRYVQQSCDRVQEMLRLLEI